MAASDSSSLFACLQGLGGTDITLLDIAIMSGQLVLPPLVVTEVLSGAQSAKTLRTVLPRVGRPAILPGYWERAGDMRCMLKQRGLMAKTADALIAQSCIDRDIPLIARDPDFRHFAEHCGLKLA